MLRYSYVVWFIVSVCVCQMQINSLTYLLTYIILFSNSMAFSLKIRKNSWILLKSFKILRPLQFKYSIHVGICVCLCRDGLTSQSKSLQFCTAMIKTGLGLQRHHKSVESSASLGPATPTPTNYIPDSIEDLLDQVLRVVHGCSDRLFVGFTDSTFRHTCRPEHRWFALVYRYVQSVDLFSKLKTAQSARSR